MTPSVDEQPAQPFAELTQSHPIAIPGQQPQNQYQHQLPQHQHQSSSYPSQQYLQQQQQPSSPLESLSLQQQLQQQQQQQPTSPLESLSLQQQQQHQQQQQLQASPSQSQLHSPQTQSLPKRKNYSNDEERRLSHNALERNRRADLHRRVMNLASVVPTLVGNCRPSRNQVLTASRSYILVLKGRLARRDHYLRTMQAGIKEMQGQLNLMRAKDGLPPYQDNRLCPSFMADLEKELEDIDYPNIPDTTQETLDQQHIEMKDGFPSLSINVNSSAAAGQPLIHSPLYIPDYSFPNSPTTQLFSPVFSNHSPLGSPSVASFPTTPVTPVYPNLSPSVPHSSTVENHGIGQLQTPSLSNISTNINGNPNINGNVNVNGHGNLNLNHNVNPNTNSNNNNTNNNNNMNATSSGEQQMLGQTYVEGLAFHSGQNAIATPSSSQDNLHLGALQYHHPLLQHPGQQTIDMSQVGDLQQSSVQVPNTSASFSSLFLDEYASPIQSQPSTPY